MSGWGQNAFVGGSYQTIQKQVNVPVLPAAGCQSELSGTRLGPSFLFDSNSFLCAGGEPGNDACTVILYAIFLGQSVFIYFFSNFIFLSIIIVYFVSLYIASQIMFYKSITIHYTFS